MRNRSVTVAELARDGKISRNAIYKAIRAGNLTFEGGSADPVKLLIQWRAKHDPTRDDKIGPALERIIEKRGLTVPAEEYKGTPGMAGAIDLPALDANGAPLYLSAEMRKFWKRATGDYELEADAKLILKTACEAFDRAAQARELIAKDGILLNNRRHPAIDIEAQAQGLFLRAMRQLGLDIEPPGPIGRPAAR